MHKAATITLLISSKTTKTTWFAMMTSKLWYNTWLQELIKIYSKINLASLETQRITQWCFIEKVQIIMTYSSKLISKSCNLGLSPGFSGSCQMSKIKSQSRRNVEPHHLNHEASFSSGNY